MYRKLLTLGFILTLSYMVFIGATVGTHYLQMFGWTEHHQTQLPMAQQEPQALYDRSAYSRKAKQAFEDLYNTLYSQKDKDITKKLNQESLDQLQTYLNDIDIRSKKPFQERFDRLSLYHTLQKDYQALFEDYEKGVLKATTTPSVIQTFNGTYYPYLQTWLLEDPENGIANRLYDLQELLIADAQTVTDMVVGTNNFLTQPPVSQIKLNVQTSELDLTPIKKAITQLNFVWPHLNRLNTIVDQIAKHKEQMVKLMDQYAVYQEDIATRDKAFSDWSKERQARLDQLTNEFQEAQKAILGDTQRITSTETIEQESDEIYMFELTDLAGYAKSDVEAWAQENALSIQFNTIQDDIASSGTVLYSKPSAGSVLSSDTIIQVFIAE